MNNRITNQEMIRMIYQILGEEESYLVVLPGKMAMGNDSDCIFGLTEKNLNVAIQDQLKPSIMIENISIPLGDICDFKIKKNITGKTEIILSRKIPGTERSFPYKLQFAKKPKNCEISSEDYKDEINRFIENIRKKIKG